MSFNPNWLIGKVVRRITTQRRIVREYKQEQDTAVESIIFEDGSQVSFGALESDWEPYVIASYAPPPKRSKRAEKIARKSITGPDLGDIMVEVLDVNGDLVDTRLFVEAESAQAWKFFNETRFARILRYGGWEEVDRKAHC